MEAYDIDFDQPRDEFRIANDAEAGWAMRKVKAIRAKRDRYVAQCEERKAAYAHALDTEINTCRKNAEHDEQYLLAMLREYTDQLPPDDFDVSKKTGVRNYRLPEGKLVYKPPVRSLAHDRDVLLAALKAPGLTHYIRTREEPAWAEIKEQAIVTEDGYVQIPDIDGALAMVDGISIAEKPASYEVVVK